MILMTFSISADDATKFYRMTTDVMSYLRVDQWIDYVKRIKTDDEVPGFYNYPPTTKAIRYYFKRFDIIGYETGLQQQFIKNITEAELTESFKVLKNPFVSKVLNILFFKTMEDSNFSRLVLLAKDEVIEDERKPLIKSIYNLLMYSSMADHMLITIHANEQEAQEISKVLQKDNKSIATDASGKVVRTKRESVEKVFYVKIDKALAKISVNELRQFVNLIKGDSTQKVLGLYNTYDYYFMYKYNRILYMKDEQDTKRGLKPKK